MRIVIALLIIMGAGTVAFFFVRGCTPIGAIQETRGSHGFSYWDGPSLKSFPAGSGRVCVADGWEPVGALEAGPGWARFPGRSGVIIRTDAFASTTLTFEKSSYIVTLIEPVQDAKERRGAYVGMIRNAFERVGSLYEDAGKQARPHTVLVTASLSGIDDERDSVYPPPSAFASYIILPPAHPRSEELFVHAVTHLYNEYDLQRPYAAAQAPFTETDFTEAEATWAELAFESSDQRRAVRRDYLLNVHEAVVTRNFSLIEAPPFNDPDAFAAMRGALPVATSSLYEDLDTQYGHYILAPLILAGIDGMLLTRGAPDSVETLLTKVHTGMLVSFYGALRAELPESDIAAMRSWMDGARIPDALVRAGVTRYDRMRSMR